MIHVVLLLDFEYCLPARLARPGARVIWNLFFGISKYIKKLCSLCSVIFVGHGEPWAGRQRETNGFEVRGAHQGRSRSQRKVFALLNIDS